ncbi:MAG: beta-N-acetylhexosaminidase [Polyangiaceae bacterium]|nr:beta-N-acetylhexosaminidase [Polyangiaceae bacterium]
MNARRIAGQLLVSGFDGSTLTAQTAGALSRGERAGVILFKRNLPTIDATAALTGSIQRATAQADGDLPALVAVDEEGGRVSRLPAGEPKLPPMRMLGAIGEVDLVEAAGRAIGARLLELGFNLDFAPVLDVDSNPNNPVIADRSFGSSPGIVAELGIAFAQGLANGGVLACGKHFPGHGDTDKDSHFDLPVVRHDRARLDRIELAPFRAACRAGIDSIMSAHVVIEGIEPGVPATFSRAAMHGLLREELGFRGVLVSDDLEMRAVSALKPPNESALVAITAGCDLLLVCEDEDAADSVFATLTREIEASPAFRARAEEAAQRVLAMRREAANRARRGPLPGPSVRQVLEQIDEAIGRSTVVP